jgi:hypothetical protein
LLDHAAAVGVQRDSARHGARGGAAIGEVVAGVGARLVGSLLEAVSMWVGYGYGYGYEGLRSRAGSRHTEAIEYESGRLCEEARCSVVGAGCRLSVQGRVLGVSVK